MGSLFAWLLLPIAFWIASIHCITDSEYTYPRFLLLGPKGVGKSSLGNVLLGCSPNDKCAFPVCSSLNSCTKNTSIVEAKFSGNFSGNVLTAGNATLIDTPGFWDGDFEEPTLMNDMLHTLKDDLKFANIIVLCFDGGRWDAGMVHMIAKLEELFGKNLWKNVMIEVTKWGYDVKSVQDRKRNGITEEDTLVAINNQLQKHFHLNHSLSGVFLDSLAVYYPHDEVQTRFFRKYSSMLWEAAMDRTPFSFKAVGQVQDARTKACGIDNDCCDDLTNEINDVKSSITKLNHDLTLKIQSNTMHIGINTNNIETNKNNIDTNKNNIETNKNNIDTNKNNIDTNKNNIDTNKNNIDTNKNNIDTNKNNIDTNKNNIDTNKNNIDTLTETTSRFVSYCGYREYTDSTGTLTYERLVTSINSFSPVGGLDIKTGKFTAPTPGTYLVNTNFLTWGAGNFVVFINKNGNNLDEGGSVSKSVDDDGDMTGRTLTIQLGTNDELYLHVRNNPGRIWYPTFCITLIK